MGPGVASGSLAIISKGVGLDRVLSGGGDIGLRKPVVRAELNGEAGRERVVLARMPSGVDLNLVIADLGGSTEDLVETKWANRNSGGGGRSLMVTETLRFNYSANKFDYFLYPHKEQRQPSKLTRKYK